MLSAVEGVKVAAPRLSRLVVPVALVILTVRFAIQRRGTTAIGRLFGPVIVIWSTVIGVAELIEVVSHPASPKARQPTYALAFSPRYIGRIRRHGRGHARHHRGPGALPRHARFRP